MVGRQKKANLWQWRAVQDQRFLHRMAGSRSQKARCRICTQPPGRFLSSLCPTTAGSPKYSHEEVLQRKENTHKPLIYRPTRSFGPGRRAFSDVVGIKLQEIRALQRLGWCGKDGDLRAYTTSSNKFAGVYSDIFQDLPLGVVFPSLSFNGRIPAPGDRGGG